MKTVLIPGLVAAALAAAQSAGDGSYVLETLRGAETIAPNAALRVNCRGPVIVNGITGTALSYEVKLRVKGPDGASARAALKSSNVRFSRQGRGEYLFFMVPAGAEMTSLQLKVPRSMREVVVSTPEGAVETYDLDGNVRADTGGGPMKADRIRGNAVLSTAGGDIRVGNIDGMAHCVTGGGPIDCGVIRGEAILETGAGDITAREVGGLLRASTGAGGIHIARAGAAVIAGTGGGPIQVGRAGGMVTLRNSGGPVQVGAASGVQCENVAGAINLSNVTGALRVSTAMGSIIAQLLAGRTLAESFLSTGRGDITVLIPSNLGVTIRAENELSDTLRRIVTEFPQIAVRMEGGQVIAEGALNGAAPCCASPVTAGRFSSRRDLRGTDHETAFCSVHCRRTGGGANPTRASGPAGPSGSAARPDCCSHRCARWSVPGGGRGGDRRRARQDARFEGGPRRRNQERG